MAQYPLIVDFVSIYWQIPGEEQEEEAEIEALT